MTEVVTDGGFFSSGTMLAPVLGPKERGVYVKAYYGGADSFSLIFGDTFRSQFELWTTFEGFEELVAHLQAHLWAAKKAREARSS